MREEITLTPEEIVAAATVGVRRKADSIRRRLTGAAPRGWYDEIEGALAEMAAAKELGVPFEGLVGVGDAPDLCGFIQVRWTDSEDKCLIVRPKDKGGEAFVLVTGSVPVYRVHGWVYGAEARLIGRLDNPNGRPPAWFVPTRLLKPIDTLLMEFA